MLYWCFGNLKGFCDSSLCNIQIPWLLWLHISQLVQDFFQQHLSKCSKHISPQKKMQRQKLVGSASCVGIHQFDRQNIDIFFCYIAMLSLSNIFRSLPYYTSLILTVLWYLTPVSGCIGPLGDPSHVHWISGYVASQSSSRHENIRNDECLWRFREHDYEAIV